MNRTMSSVFRLVALTGLVIIGTTFLVFGRESVNEPATSSFVWRSPVIGMTNSELIPWRQRSLWATSAVPVAWTILGFTLHDRLLSLARCRSGCWSG